MSRDETATELFGIQGWEVMENGVHEEENCWVISMAMKAGSGYRCARCGKGYLFAYDHQPMRLIRDFPIRRKACFLEVCLPRVECSDCGVHVARQDWVEPGQRITLRYEKYVALLCTYMPALDVADLEGLDKGTVYRIDRKWLERRAALTPQRPVRRLGIDEIAIKKGHKYATVFYDLDRREVIGMVNKRTQRAASRFFRRQGKNWCRQIEAVCLDLWRPYINSLSRYCRRAVLVLDKFHLYSYLSQALDEVRRIEQNKADLEGRSLIKGCRWLLMTPFRRLRGRKRQTLVDIMVQNESLYKGHVLKESFEGLYQCSDPDSGQSFLEDWFCWCRQCALKPFQKVARRLKRWMPHILSFFEHRITNAVAEGINNKIKVLKRRSYGFHDEAYFFLKVMDASGTLIPLDAVSHSF